MSDPGRPTVWFNPACSTCRRLRALLEERGVEARYRRYLEDPPSVAELAEVVRLTGSDDPSVLVRWKDGRAESLGLAGAAPEAVLAALAAHPELIVRPVLVLGDRAVVARPPEVALDLLPPAAS